MSKAVGISENMVERKVSRSGATRAQWGPDLRLTVSMAAYICIPALDWAYWACENGLFPIAHWVGRQYS